VERFEFIFGRVREGISDGGDSQVRAKAVEMARNWAFFAAGGEIAVLDVS